MEETISDMLGGTVLSGLTLAGLLAVFTRTRNQTKRVSCPRVVDQIVSVVPAIIGRFFRGWLRPYGLNMNSGTLLRKAFKTKCWNFPEKIPG